MKLSLWVFYKTFQLIDTYGRCDFDSILVRPFIHVASIFVPTIYSSHEKKLLLPPKIHGMHVLMRFWTRVNSNKTTCGNNNNDNNTKKIATVMTTTLTTTITTSTTSTTRNVSEKRMTKTTINSLIFVTTINWLRQKCFLGTMLPGSLLPKRYHFTISKLFLLEASSSTISKLFLSEASSLPGSHDIVDCWLFCCLCCFVVLDVLWGVGEGEDVNAMVPLCVFACVIVCAVKYYFLLLMRSVTSIFHLEESHSLWEVDPPFGRLVPFRSDSTCKKISP